MIDADDRSALAALAREALARRSVHDFCVRMDPTYRPAAHTRVICEHLDALERGDIQKLMIFMPPRHGKTYHAGERFPAYCLGRHPEWPIISASYTINRARASSRKARNLFREKNWPFEARLDPEAQAVDAWLTTAGGAFIASGVGGSMTGFGAKLLVVDDPIKGRAEANSQVKRDSDWDWYTDVAKTRLQESARELMMMTRWHEDDIAGRALNSAGASKWTVLRLPALAEENDLLGRSVGEPLWPESGIELPSPELGEISTRSFAALYQGNPKPAEGDLFKREWFGRRYGAPPAFVRATIFLDGAWKEGIANDRSAIAVWATNGIDYYLVHAWAGRVEYPDLKAKVSDIWERFRGIAPTVVPCVEDAASGIPIIQEFRRTTSIPIVGVTVDKSKFTRAEAITPVFESRKALLPERAPWLDEWIEEHIAFPSATHDDFVDTTSGALARLYSPPSTFGWVSVPNSR